MNLSQMYNLLMRRGYDQPQLDFIKGIANKAYTNPSGVLISQYGEDTPELRFANAYQSEFNPDTSFPSDTPYQALGSLFGGPESAVESADMFNSLSDEELLEYLKRNGLTNF